MTHKRLERALTVANVKVKIKRFITSHNQVILLYHKKRVFIIIKAKQSNNNQRPGLSTAKVGNPLFA